MKLASIRMAMTDWKVLLPKILRSCRWTFSLETVFFRSILAFSCGSRPGFRISLQDCFFSLLVFKSKKSFKNNVNKGTFPTTIGASKKLTEAVTAVSIQSLAFSGVLLRKK
jgi:hypothetical protein